MDGINHNISSLQSGRMYPVILRYIQKGRENIHQAYAKKLTIVNFKQRRLVGRNLILDGLTSDTLIYKG
jgi:hypothetical protein